MTLKKWVALLAAVVLCLTGLSGCASNKTVNEVTTVYTDKEVGFQLDMPAVGDKVAIMHTSMGDICLRFFPEAAPKAVENFLTHAENGYYDGLTFHRVIEDFMIQGGDPDGDGSGGSEQTIKGEFSANGVTNDLSHERGVVSMARTIVSMDSASSQFFIMHTSTYKDSLDGQYAAFGKVVYGMEVVDAIAESSTYAYSDRPKSDIVMSSVYFVTPN